MRNNFYKKILFIVLCTIIKNSYTSFASTVLVDKIVAKVGNQPILLSEVEYIYIQVLSQKSNSHEMSKQEILNSLIDSKLLVSQAKKEGIVVNEDRLNQELNYRISYLVDRLGSISGVENYFGKSLHNIKHDFKKQIQDQILAEEVRQKIISHVQITPEEVFRFFSDLSDIDIPIHPDEYVVYQLIKKVVPSKEEVDIITKKLLEYRNRAELGEDFSKILLNENHNVLTHCQCETLSWVIGAKNAPEYESQIVSLSPGNISQPIKGYSGIYIVKIISKDITKIDVVHIYISYDIQEKGLQHTRDYLLSIRDDVLSNKITFEEAVSLFADNEVESINGLKCSLEDLPTDVFYTIENNDMQIGDISEPIICAGANNASEIKLIYIKSKTPCRKATLENEYEKISDLCLNSKKSEILKIFLEKIKKNTSVWINQI